MKALIATAMLVLVPLAWSFAQSTSTPSSVTGPVELHNPHRRSSIGTTEATPFSVSPIATTALSPTTVPPVALYADGPYLFVLRGDSLFQFNKKTLKLLHSVQLPSSPSSASESKNSP